jgi:tetratricopeptide (TPR) repeat protein
MNKNVKPIMKIIMKKVMMMAMMMVASATAFAGDSDGLKAILKAKTYNEANQLLQQNVASLADNAEKAKAYNHVLDLVMDKVNAETKIITENQVSAQMGQADKQKAYDTLGLAEAICQSIELASECNKYDQLPNAKGKVAPKFAEKNAMRVWVNRVHLVNIGQEEARKNNDAAVLKYWGTFVDSRNEPLFAAMDKAPEQAYVGQVALFAGRYAYQAKDMARANKYFDEAMKDPEQKKEALNFKLIAMKSQLKTRQDSLNYAEQLKALMADNPDNDVILDGLYQMYEGMKMKAEQKSLLEGILAKNPNSFVALADMGIMYMGENDAAGAIPYLRKAVEVKDDNVSVIYYLATSLCVVAQDEKTSAADKKNYYKEAVGLYDKCKQLDPDMMQIKWGYNRFNAYYNFYGPEAPETKQAEADYKN